MKNWFKIILSSILVIICLFFVIFQTHKAAVYAQIGSFYESRNNYRESQKFYEKSYKLGNTDTNFRIKYISSLVNSPLTIEAQEKLVAIAQDEIRDSASASAEYFLRNLKKEIHNKYPENYVKQAALNQKIMHWGKMPITYSFKNKKNVPEELVNAVNDAFDAWERASQVRIRFDRIQSDNADIVVIFEGKQIKKAEYGEKYVIANTTPYNTQTKLEKMVMKFSVYDLDGDMFTPNQIYNTALHEIFHALGFMGHSMDENSIMYLSKNGSALYSDDRMQISEPDKMTLELFYKIKPDITDANELKYDYIPYLILGSSSEVNLAKADEAKSYIRKAPTIPAGYIDYAQILLNEKRYTAAIGYLEKALRLATDDETKNMVYYNLAVTNYYDGNYKLALIYTEKAKEYKDEPELHALNAEIYLKQDEINKSIEEYEYLIGLNPKNIDYAINLANIYIKNKHYFKARKVLKNYQHNNPNDKNNQKLSPYKILLF